MSTPAVTPDQQKQSDLDSMTNASSQQQGSPSDLENQAAASPPAGATARAAAQGQQPTGTPNAQPAPAQSGSKWQNVVVGALRGLESHAEGALKGLATGGIPGAVEGAISPKTAGQKFQNQQDMAHAQVDVQKAQAANLLADAHIRQTQADNLPKDLALRQKEQDEQQAQDYINRGIAPVVVTHDDSPEAALAAAQKILEDSSHVIVRRMGDGYAAFDLNAMGQSPKFLDDVNDWQLVNGRSTLSPMQWNNKAMMTPGMKSNLQKGSQDGFNPVPGKTLQEVDSQLTQYKTLLTTAQAVPDSQFANKDRRVKQLQGAIDKLQAQEKNLKGEQETNIQNQMRVAKVRGESNQNAKGVKVLGPNGVETYARLEDAIKTGAIAPETMKAVDPYLKTANDAERSYRMMQDAYSDFKAGTATGAQSMVALSNHLATTFGGVKGNRITKEMIQQHLGARGISDDALVATQKLSNGDALSPDQWKAFNGLITNSRRYAWGIAATQARAKQIDIRGLVPKDLGGQADIRKPEAALTPPGVEAKLANSSFSQLKWNITPLINGATSMTAERFVTPRRE